jgi:hypothetical protein
MREFERNYNQDFFGFWFLVKKMRNISSAIFYGIIRLVGHTEIKTQRQRNAAKATVLKALRMLRIATCAVPHQRTNRRTIVPAIVEQ